MVGWTGTTGASEQLRTSEANARAATSGRVLQVMKLILEAGTDTVKSDHLLLQFTPQARSYSAGETPTWLCLTNGLLRGHLQSEGICPNAHDDAQPCRCPQHRPDAGRPSARRVRPDCRPDREYLPLAGPGRDSSGMALSHQDHSGSIPRSRRNGGDTPPLRYTGDNRPADCCRQPTLSRMARGVGTPGSA